jgi:5-methylcytosine-specific restriction protein A
MAARPKSICRHAACGKAIDAPGYCERHHKERIGWNKTSTASAGDRGYGHAWRKLREIVMRRDYGLCQCDQCDGGTKRVMRAQEVDHITPKSQGGSDDLSNLRAVSNECHKRITKEQVKNK